MRPLVLTIRLLALAMTLFLAEEAFAIWVFDTPTTNQQFDPNDTIHDTGHNADANANVMYELYESFSEDCYWADFGQTQGDGTWDQDHVPPTGGWSYLTDILKIRLFPGGVQAGVNILVGD